MKTLELPDEVFEAVEAYRRKKKISRSEAVTQLINDAKLVQQWWEDLLEHPRGAKLPSLEEADALAIKAVKDTRHKHHLPE